MDREVSFSFIELTLRLINFDDNEQVATARHSITFSESNHGVDLSGTLLPAGLTYKYSSGVSEGAHTAVRALIDLSVASLLGRQAGIRFDDCFKNTASPAAPAETDETTQARQALKQLGFSDSKPLHEVLAEFQIEAGLHPSGTLSYETRRALGFNGQKIIQLPRPDLRVDVLPIDYQNGVTAKVDAIFGISVSVSRSTEVWCYVQPPSSGTSAVLKIFPNRDMPNAHFTAGTRRDIPPFDSQPFLLNADAPGQWQVGCAAVPRPISGQIAEASAKNQQMVLRGWDLDQIASNLRSASDETLFAKRTFNVAR